MAQAEVFAARQGETPAPRFNKGDKVSLYGHRLDREYTVIDSWVRYSLRTPSGGDMPVDEQFVRAVKTGDFALSISKVPL
jgi:Ni/Co efflux regulator RcnB